MRVEAQQPSRLDPGWARHAACTIDDDMFNLLHARIVHAVKYGNASSVHEVPAITCTMHWGISTCIIITTTTTTTTTTHTHRVKNASVSETTMYMFTESDGVFIQTATCYCIHVVVCLQ